MTPASLLNWSVPVAMWLIVIAFNIAAVLLLRLVLRKENLKGFLREKSARAPGKTQTSGGGSNDVAQGSLAVTENDTSYSRVAGMIGAVILVCFFWGIANVLFVEAFESPENIAKILSGVGPFFLSGSALFAPYAFNQLAGVFKTPPV